MTIAAIGTPATSAIRRSDVPPASITGSGSAGSISNAIVLIVAIPLRRAPTRSPRGASCVAAHGQADGGAVERAGELAGDDAARQHDHSVGHGEHLLQFGAH